MIKKTNKKWMYEYKCSKCGNENPYGVFHTDKCYCPECGFKSFMLSVDEQHCVNTLHYEGNK